MIELVFLYAFVKNTLFYADVLGLKGEKCGHAYTDEAIKWLETHYRSFLDVANEFDLSDDVILAAAMAVTEEYSNRKNVHALSDLIQDTMIRAGLLLYIDDFWRPDVGPGNINIDTAMTLKNKIASDLSYKLESKKEVNSKFGSKIEMAQYLLTADGTALIGALEMHRVTRRYLSEDKYKADDMSIANKIQNMVDIWREGDGRYDRMDEKLQKNNKHVPEHKYKNQPNIPIHNYETIRKIMKLDQ